MIAKIVKGSGFREVTGYIIDSKKNARIIAHAGLFIEDVDTITKAFEAQAGMNPKVSRPVGHIALGFSKEDERKQADQPDYGRSSFGIHGTDGHKEHTVLYSQTFRQGASPYTYRLQPDRQ